MLHKAFPDFSLMATIKEKLKVKKSRSGLKAKFVPKPPEDPAVIEARWAKKKDRIHKLANDISRLRLNVSKDLKLQGEDEKTFLTALIIAIQDKTGERIGNNDSAAIGHFGVSGFLKRHISISGNEITLKYRGKSGVDHEKTFSSEKIAKALKWAIKNSPESHVFTTSDGQWIGSDQVNKYLSAFDVSSKNLRGFFINKALTDKLHAIPIPEKEKDRKKIFNSLCKKIASTVGHGAGTCKKHYIVPELPEQYIVHGKIIDLKSQKYYKDGGIVNHSENLLEVQKKKASGRWTDASFNSLSTEKPSSDRAVSGTNDDIDDSRTQNKDSNNNDQKFELGGNIITPIKNFDKNDILDFDDANKKYDGGKSIEGGTQSLWMSEGKIPSHEKLSENMWSDACIVGAGISGLSCAYQLLKKGKSVVILDKGKVGYGETLRTTAHLCGFPDAKFSELVRLHGKDQALLSMESHERAIDEIEAICKEEGIDCGFERVSGFLFSNHKKDLHGEFELMEELGREVYFLESTPIESFDVGACIQFPNQAKFDPLRYLRGLQSVVSKMGGMIFEDSDATEIEGGKKAFVKANGHKVRCENVIIATDSPVNNLVTLHLRQAPYRSYVISAELKEDVLQNALYWDDETQYHYIRLDKDPNNPEITLLTVGGEDHRVGQEKNEEKNFGELERWARHRFPIGDVKYRWSGQIMEANDRFAFIGRNPGDENVFVVTGASGTGITYATIAGMLISDLIMGYENPWEKIYDPSRVTVGSIGKFLEEGYKSTIPYVDWLKSCDEKPLQKGEGKIVCRGLEKIAAYRDEEGNVHALSAKCTHLGGVVNWNNVEKSWDCPCHGSRFDVNGDVLNGPAIKPLENVEIKPDEKFASGGKIGKTIEVYHGGYDLGKDLVLRSGHYGGKKTGQDAGAIFFTPSLKYAKGYAKGEDNVYKYDLKITDKIFDGTNESHYKKLKEGFLKNWQDNYGSKEDAIQDYQYAVEQIRSSISHGAIDWGTGSQFLEQIENAGFEGIKFLERPAENIEIEKDGSFKLSGPLVYSYGLFKDEVKVEKYKPGIRYEEGGSIEGINFNDLTVSKLAEMYSKEQLDELIKQLQQGTTDLLHAGEIKKAEAAIELTGRVIDAYQLAKPEKEMLRIREQLNPNRYDIGGNLPNNDDFADPEKSRKFVSSKITKDEIHRIISGASPVANGAAIQAAASFLRRGEGASPTSGSPHFFKGQDEERLKQYISENNLWLPFPEASTKIGEGGEAQVYLQGRYVIKLNDIPFYSSWEDYFNSLLLHNHFFRGTAYELIGFSEYRYFDGIIIYAVVRQPFIKETSATDLNQVKEFMWDRGFVSTSATNYYHPELGILLRDLHGGNVLTKDGLPYFIDTIFYIENPPPTLEIGGNLSENDDFANSDKKRIFTINPTKDEIRNVISGTRATNARGTIEAISDYLGEGSRTSQEAKGSKFYKRQEAERIRTYATRHNLWVPIPNVEKYFNEGAEQKVYFVGKDSVVKSNNSIFYNSWQDYFHSLLLHNLFFPTTSYEFVGFAEEDGELLVVVKQPFIEDTEPTDLNQVKKFMSDNGFINTRNNDYRNDDLGVILEDLHEENVLTRNGFLYFIDTVFYLTANADKKKEDGGFISESAQKQIDEYRKEGIFIKEDDRPVAGTLPMSRFNGPNADIHPNQLSVGTKGVRNWKKIIIAGERPYILVDYVDYLQENRVKDAHHRLKAYEELGFSQVPVIDVSGRILNPEKRMASGGSLDSDYKKWKRQNVTLRGMREVGQENEAGAMLGRGLYSAALSNRSLAKEYGTVHFAVNARPKNPKKFNTLNDWEIWFYNNLVYNYSKAKGKEFPDKRDFNASTTIEKEMQKLGYDGIEIVGREMVNFKPSDVVYFRTEDELRDYYERKVKMVDGGVIKTELLTIKEREDLARGIFGKSAIINREIAAHGGIIPYREAMAKRKKK